MPPPAPARVTGPTPAQAIIEGEQRYTDIRVPVLAVYAIPHNFGSIFHDPAQRAAAEARDAVSFGAQADAFEKGVARAQVVRLPNASHYVFKSSEAEVLREMRAFIYETALSRS